MTMKAAVLIPAPEFHEAWNWAYDVEAEALRRGGIDVEPRPWSDPGALDAFDVVLPLVAWGYHLDPPRWHGLLDRMEGEQAATVNPIALLRWNSDKRYLTELADVGVATVPTQLVESLDEAALAAARHEFGDVLVIKPVMSASADGTFMLRRGDDLPDSVRGRTMMVQPFLSAVADEGEYSLLLFDGRFSHAIVKRPKAGDFRVQPHLGGTEVACTAPEGAIDLARAALAAAPARPAYARVDLIRRNDGTLAVIELELIEPALWLQHAPEPGVFAAAVRSAAERARE